MMSEKFERPMTVQEVKEKITDFVGNAKIAELQLRIDSNYGNFSVHYNDGDERLLLLNKIRITNQVVNEEHWKNWKQEIKEEFESHLLDQFKEKKEQRPVVAKIVEIPVDSEPAKESKKEKEAKALAQNEADRLAAEGVAAEEAAKIEAEKLAQDELPMSNEQAEVSERPVDPPA